MEFTEQLIFSFAAGGALCVIAQLLIDLTKLTPARILVIYVCFGVFLYAVGVYQPMFEMLGAGVSVPLIGFGANIAKGVEEAVINDGLIGALTGGLTSSAAGISAALIFGFIFSLIFKSKPKRM